MTKKQKLELTWIGKERRPKLEPRILLEDPAKSYHAKQRDNRRIFGDNLLALKALEQEFTGKVKCVFIDPPYNTGSAFSYAPLESRWWQHGHSSERDFIFVTTQNLSTEQLQALSDEVGSTQSLLVCCSAFRGVMAAQAAERWPNLTLKKIPKMVLACCEWGHDDYSLNVANLPIAAPEPQAPAMPPASKKTKKAPLMPDLFDGIEDKA